MVKMSCMGSWSNTRGRHNYSLAHQRVFCRDIVHDRGRNIFLRDVDLTTADDVSLRTVDEPLNPHGVLFCHYPREGVGILRAVGVERVVATPMMSSRDSYDSDNSRLLQRSE